jgi:hypothetical protein
MVDTRSCRLLKLRARRRCGYNFNAVAEPGSDGRERGHWHHGKVLDGDMVAKHEGDSSLNRVLCRCRLTPHSGAGHEGLGPLCPRVYASA